MKKKKPKTAAIFTLFRADDLSRDGKRRIVEWLRRQANFIARHGGKNPPKLSGTFRARYLYE